MTRKTSFEEGHGWRSVAQCGSIGEMMKCEQSPSSASPGSTAAHFEATITPHYTDRNESKKPSNEYPYKIRFGILVQQLAVWCTINMLRGSDFWIKFSSFYSYLYQLFGKNVLITLNNVQSTENNNHSLFVAIRSFSDFDTMLVTAKFKHSLSTQTENFSSSFT